MAKNSFPKSPHVLTDHQFAISDRRVSGRFRTVFFDVTIARDDDVSLVRARNLSDTGMMLRAHTALGVGESVLIGLSERLAIRGTVQWFDAGFCGVEFERPIDCEAMLRAEGEYRREDRRGGRLRLTATRLATTYADNGVRAVRVVDVSHRGMGLTHDGSLGNNMSLKLAVETGVERNARVCWADDSRAGIQLLCPLSCEEVARITSATRVTDDESDFAPAG